MRHERRENVARRLVLSSWLVATIVCLLGSCGSDDTAEIADTATTPAVAKQDAGTVKAYGSRGYRYNPQPRDHLVPVAQDCQEFAGRPPSLQLAEELLSCCYTEIYRQILVDLREKFPEIPVLTQRERLSWNAVTFCKSGERFGCVRFTSPLDEPATFVSCRVEPMDNPAQWGVLPAEGTMFGFQENTDATEFNLDLEGVDEPNENRVIFQARNGRQILPGKEYFLFFAFPEAIPVTMAIAVRLTTGDDLDNYSEPLAEAMGIRFPFRPKAATPGAFVALSEVTRGRGDSGVKILEEGLSMFPEHPDLLSAIINLDCAKADWLLRVGRGGPEVVPLVRQAVEYANRYVAVGEFMGVREKARVNQAFYLAARVAAIEGKAADTISALRQSRRFGRIDPNQIALEQDFAPLRGKPEFEALLKELN